MSVSVFLPLSQYKTPFLIIRQIPPQRHVTHSTCQTFYLITRTILEIREFETTPARLPTRDERTGAKIYILLCSEGESHWTT